MLIRVVNDHVKNKFVVDKLIRVDGIPESMFFVQEGDKKVLKEPWEPDVEKHYPKRFIEKAAQWFSYDHRIQPMDPSKPVIYSNRMVPAVRIDVGTVPGQRGWEEVQRLFKAMIPAGTVVPDPAIVGTLRDWMLDPSDVPFVDLRKYAEAPATESAPEEAPAKPDPDRKDERIYEFVCECGAGFDKQKALSMHRTVKRHKIKEKAVA